MPLQEPEGYILVVQVVVHPRFPRVGLVELELDRHKYGAARVGLDGA